MPYSPAFLYLPHAACFVVGGGAVAERKVDVRPEFALALQIVARIRERLANGSLRAPECAC